MEDFERLNYYELLGVSPAASADEIKRAYRQQMSRYHPDRYATAAPAEQHYASQRTQQINEAYRVLSDFRQRQIYDRSQSIKPSRRTAGQPMAMPATSPPPVSSTDTPTRDHQAELYAQGQAHLRAGRYLQAVAVLRQLQQINPFYRDSAALLAQAEAASRAAPPPPPATSTPPTATLTERLKRIPPLFLIGGAALALVLGIVAALLLQPESDSLLGGSAPSATPIAAATATAPAVGLAITITPPEATAPPEASATSLVEPTVEPTGTPEPTIEPTAEPVFEPTPTVPPTAEPTAAPVVPEAPTAVPAAPPVVEEVPSPVPPAPPAAPPPPPTAVPTLAPSLNPPPPPAQEIEQGTPLFVYDFTSQQGWAIQQGNGWSVGVTDGVYRINAIPGIGNIWSYRTVLTTSDYVIGVDTQVRGGLAGLMVRFQDFNNYLAFLVDPADGSYRLEQIQNGGSIVLAQGSNPAIVASEDAYNRLVARLQGDNIQLFINGETMGDVTVGVPQTPLYGLVAVAPTNPVESVFDNVQIRAIE